MKFRKFKDTDELRLAEIIRDTWNYERLSPTPEVALLMGKIYLYSCLTTQNFNIVATHNEIPIGIIMGNIKGRTKHNNSLYEQNLLQYSQEMYNFNEGRFILDLFAGFEQLDKELLIQVNKDYDAELVFFVTDSNYRDQHIGTTLLHQFFKECTINNCKLIYVYTDATCNYGFYEHQGFIRVNQRMHSVHNYQFEFYVYEKELS